MQLDPASLTSVTQTQNKPYGLAGLTQVKDWPIFAKILATVIIALIPLLAAVVLYLVPLFEARLHENRTRALSQTVELAYSIVDGYGKQVETGKMSLKAAQEAARVQINALRYGASGYFFVCDSNCIILVHPFSPALVGKDQSDTKDPNGTRLFYDLVGQGKAKGEGKVDYYWPKPGSKQPVQKETYFKTYRPWGWNVCSGAYLDDVAAEVWQIKVAFGVVIVITMGLALGIALLSARKITIPIGEMRSAARKLADGEMDVAITMTSGDEIGQMADAFRSLISSQLDLARMADAAAEGDLRGRVRIKGEHDRLGRSFANMMEHMRVIIGALGVNSDAVAATSKSLAASCSRTEAAAGEVARNIQEVAEAADQSAKTSQEIATDSEQQAQSAIESATVMERLRLAVDEIQEGGQRQQQAAEQASRGIEQASRAVEAVTASASQVSTLAQKATAVAEIGGQAIDRTILSMGRIRDQVQSSAESITELGEKGKQIGVIVEAIDQISEQTNLLALNAAIEAARAGEHGRGFAVVAGEVRKLAERAARSTQEIGDLIAAVRDGVDRAVASIEMSTREVSEGATQSEEAGSALLEILEAAGAVASEADSVRLTADTMAAEVADVRHSIEAVQKATAQAQVAVAVITEGADQVGVAIAKVATISQNSAAASEQMSAAAEEVSASTRSVAQAIGVQETSIDQISIAANELTAMAARLQEIAGKFQVEVAEGGDERAETGFEGLRAA